MKKLVNFNRNLQYKSLWLDELDMFLKTQAAFTVIQLYGFLTAICSCPKLVLPSQWLPLSKIQDIDFANEKQATSIMSDIMLIYNNINITLREKTYKPILYIPPGSNKNSASYKEIWEEMQKNTTLWAKGYCYGVQETWPFKGNMEFTSEINSLLEAIYCLNLSKQELIKECKELNMATEKYDQIIIQSLPEIVIEIYDFCLTKREEYSPKVTSEVSNDFKVIGNELCRCSSGKKFKKCCLN